MLARLAAVVMLAAVAALAVGCATLGLDPRGPDSPPPVVNPAPGTPEARADDEARAVDRAVGLVSVISNTLPPPWGGVLWGAASIGALWYATVYRRRRGLNKPPPANPSGEG